ncbi:Phosphoserine phosphatase RsbP [Streptomyces sp. YIM 130001]|uniref:ATP-binding SpoIIE family protein phosphatase n=1 Tax=Streptomyces sp. YIM 130001 TaxID=2259644 RepID=UPI000E655803|nr:SpoIIE family protein phosphatase [Streptomyces sp. YIM 130001]RII11312.1 Phosphoserine phosphatase RsbP [Streptomyces sp. YIM 130001]
MGTEDGGVMPPVGEILTAIGTGLWHWDTATGNVIVDAVAARLLGLPAEGTTLTEAGTRARFHPVDWNEIDGIVALAVAEGTPAEVRLRVVDGDGQVLRTVRSRSWPRVSGAARSGPYSHDYQLTGTLQEAVDLAPGASAHGAVTGDWRRSREAFLLDAGRALAEARSTSEVLRVAAGLSMPGFSPDGLAVFGVRGERLTIVGHHGQDESEADPFADLTVHSDYPAAEVVRGGRAVYLSSPAEYRDRYPTGWPLAAHFGRQSWAFLPLIVAGRTIGAWMAAFTYHVSFTPDERSVLTTVARMLAQALSRAGVADTERELTDGLQRSMLPALGPEIPGMQVAARYVPTGGGLQVGGDWYDMIPLPSGRYAFVIGDVQGHDVRAASLMGQLRIALRAYAAEGHRADAVLSRATRFLCGISEARVYGSTGGLEAVATDARFATCLYVEADPATGTLEMARAGHPDPVIRMGDGTAVLRHVDGGLPLGIDPDTDYPITRFGLGPGETILLCTDGLIETGGHDLLTGWVRVRDILEAHHGDDLEVLADSLLAAVHGPPSYYSTGPLADRREDDIAMLLLGRTAREQPTGAGGPASSERRRIAMTVAQAAPEGVAEARRQLRELLHDWADSDQVDSAVLMVSEMLTNVLVHTDGDALLVAEAQGPQGHRWLRVEVSDGSDQLPHKRDPGELASSGRGLVLMEILAERWGVDPRGEGKSIWFELCEGEEERGADQGAS